MSRPEGAAWRGDRAAECGGLENRCAPGAPGVRIPPSPLLHQCGASNKRAAGHWTPVSLCVVAWSAVGYASAAVAGGDASETAGLVDQYRLIFNQGGGTVRNVEWLRVVSWLVAGLRGLHLGSWRKEPGYGGGARTRTAWPKVLCLRRVCAVSGPD